MAFTNIEVITKDNEKFSFEIQTVELRALNCLGIKIEMLDKICTICVSKGILLVRTEDRDFRNGRQNAPIIKDNRKENNIYAFDWQGNRLWNIGEIVGDIKMAFNGMTYITHDEAKREFGISAEPSHDLLKCIAEGFTFIIDVTAHKLLCKVSGKAK